MQLSQVSKKVNKKEKSINNALYIMGAVLVVFVALFLVYGVDTNNIDYALSKRIPRVLAIALGGGCIAFSTIVFQTITNNQILTPSVLGLDSLYVLVQSVIVYVFGSSSILIANQNINFIINVGIMIVASILLYKVLFERSANNIFFLLLVGMIFGTLFKSGTSFLQMMIDPNEFLGLQSSITASLNNIKTDILIISGIMIILVIPFIIDDIKYLDVLSLGTDFDGINKEEPLSDASKLYLLKEELLKEGFTKLEIEKIFYKNFIRVMKKVLK